MEARLPVNLEPAAHHPLCSADRISQVSDSDLRWDEGYHRTPPPHTQPTRIQPHTHASHTTQTQVSDFDSRWGEGYQQDAEEFLHSLLTALQVY